MAFPLIYFGARLYFGQPLIAPSQMDFVSNIAEIEADEQPDDPPRNKLEAFWRHLVSSKLPGLIRN